MMMIAGSKTSKNRSDHSLPLSLALSRERERRKEKSRVVRVPRFITFPIEKGGEIDSAPKNELLKGGKNRLICSSSSSVAAATAEAAEKEDQQVDPFCVSNDPRMEYRQKIVFFLLLEKTYEFCKLFNQTFGKKKNISIFVSPCMEFFRDKEESLAFR